MKSKIIVTDDNSKTLLIPALNETYHSTKGAITEAQHVFIKEGLLFTGLQELKIFEMGFGTGLNALLTLNESDHKSLKIIYHSVESNPLDYNLISDMSYISDLKFDQLKESYDQMHLSPFNKEISITEKFSFVKWHETIESLELKNNQYDLIYYDAFGPKVQPELWDIPVLRKVYEALKTEGILVTYCAQGQFKRNLKTIGFEVSSLPGPPGKREMTRAVKK